MKVLVLQAELGMLRGGGENFTTNLFKAFAARGHKVAAIFAADRDSKYPFALPSEIEPIPISGWWPMALGQATLSSLGSRLPRRLKSKWDYCQQALSWRTFRWYRQRFQSRIESELRYRCADFNAIYVHGNTLLASKAAEYCPTVLRLPGPVTAELEPMLRKVHKVCANGDALIQIRTFLNGHATELPIGIDLELFGPGSASIRQILGWEKTDFVLGYVGRLTHVKGVDILSSAFREIAQEEKNLRLLIIGNGEEARNIQSYLAREIANGAVHIEPDVAHERLADWYRAIDLLIMPSRYENYSNALLEAMACGVPFLASSVGGNKIMAETGAGWLFQRESVISLTASLRNILSARFQLRARGQKGLEYVRTHHSWAATAQRLEEILSSEVGEPHV
jgi:glycosyltransferase involved in cell wall biosynthesis